MLAQRSLAGLDSSEYLLTIHRMRKNGMNLVVTRMIIASNVSPLSVECQWVELGSGNSEGLTVQAWRSKPSSSR